MTNPWKLTSFALAAMLAVTAVRSASADVQPKMRDALASLQSAATSLENAARDKGGHRAKALELTKAAIAEVEAGIKFDNKH
jgi:hypothetical protein